MNVLCNDKVLVTVAVTILGLASLYWGYMTGISAENIVTAIVSGLFGITAGAALQRTHNERKDDR